jgi:hypothetical protein
MTTTIRQSPSGRTLSLFSEVASSEFERAYTRASLRKDFSTIGHNTSIPAGQTEDVWHGTLALYPGWLQSSERLRIRAGGNANDSSNGSGARSVVLQPHRSDFTWIDDESVVLTTAGASASAPTTESFQRCIRAYVKTTGSYANGTTNGANAGPIVIETVSGIEIATIDTGDNDAQMSMFTVPAGFTLWLSAFSMAVDANQPATVSMYYRSAANIVSAPFSARRTLLTATGVTGLIQFPLGFRVALPEKTDVWVRATSAAGAGASGVSVAYSGLLLSND